MISRIIGLFKREEHKEFVPRGFYPSRDGKGMTRQEMAFAWGDAGMGDSYWAYEDEYCLAAIPGEQRTISEPVYAIVESFSERGRWTVAPADDRWEAGRFVFDMKYNGTLKWKGRDGDHTTRRGLSSYRRGLSSAMSVTFRDSITGEEWTSKCHTEHYEPDTARDLGLPVPDSFPGWMTTLEKVFVLAAIRSANMKVQRRALRVQNKLKARANGQQAYSQRVERRRLSRLYCDK